MHEIDRDQASHTRRSFIKRVIVGGAALGVSGAPLVPPEPLAAKAPEAQEPPLRALDHVAVPMRNVDGMVAFYRGLGLEVRETGRIVSVHFGDQKINFHTPELWGDATFTLRAAAAEPPCGDFCWVWEGTESSLRAALRGVGAEVIAEGERQGGRNGGNDTGQSLYVRDPDGNLLEFIRYPAP